jgi:hypothetical protein
MNDSLSIVLATSVLALGGLGLYMFRNTYDDEDNTKKEKNSEENIMDLSGLFNWGESDDKDDKDDKDENKDTVLDNEIEEYEIKPRRKTSMKTQRNRKYTGSSRRRYYQ